jgi:hypothetical protein
VICIVVADGLGNGESNAMREDQLVRIVSRLGSSVMGIRRLRVIGLCGNGR